MWKSGFNAKVPRMVYKCWRFVVVGPFSTEDPKKHHTAEQPGKTPPLQLAPHDRGAKEEEKKQKQKQKKEAAERNNKNKKKMKKNDKKANENKEGEKERGRARPIRGKQESAEEEDHQKTRKNK